MSGMMNDQQIARLGSGPGSSSNRAGEPRVLKRHNNLDDIGPKDVDFDEDDVMAQVGSTHKTI